MVLKELVKLIELSETDESFNQHLVDEMLNGDVELDQGSDVFVDN